MSTYFLNPFEKWEPFAKLTEEKIELSFKRTRSQINLLIEMFVSPMGL